jgi:chitodextrinase
MLSKVSTVVKTLPILFEKITCEKCVSLKEVTDKGYFDKGLYRLSYIF